MVAVEAGHTYEVENMNGGTQTIQFIKKVPQSDPTEPMQTLVNGTTNEEVLKMLIDRLYFLQAKMSCRENAIVITKLEEALMWLRKRTEDRVARNVEGKALE